MILGTSLVRARRTENSVIRSSYGNDEGADAAAVRPCGLIALLAERGRERAATLGELTRWRRSPGIADGSARSRGTPRRPRRASARARAYTLGVDDLARPWSSKPWRPKKSTSNVRQNSRLRPSSRALDLERLERARGRRRARATRRATAQRAHLAEVLPHHVQGARPDEVAVGRLGDPELLHRPVEVHPLLAEQDASRDERLHERRRIFGTSLVRARRTDEVGHPNIVRPGGRSTRRVRHRPGAGAADDEERMPPGHPLFVRLVPSRPRRPRGRGSPGPCRSRRPC